MSEDGSPFYTLRARRILRESVTEPDVHSEQACLNTPHTPSECLRVPCACIRNLLGGWGSFAKVLTNGRVSGIKGLPSERYRGVSLPTAKAKARCQGRTAAYHKGGSKMLGCTAAHHKGGNKMLGLFAAHHKRDLRWHNVAGCKSGLQKQMFRRQKCGA